MASPAVIDIELLAQPIDGESPTGLDMHLSSSFDSEFQKIKDARNTARDVERAAISNGGDSEIRDYTHWKQVSSLSQTILINTSKDLDVCAWLLESLARLHDFVGIRDGATLIERLVSEYWNDIFPLPDEDGIETRLASLNSLNGGNRPGTLVEPINFIMVTASTGDRDFALWQYRQACDCDAIQDPEKRSIRLMELGYSLNDLQVAAQSTSSNFYIETTANIAEALAALAKLDRALDNLCGADAPSFGQIRDSLETALAAFRYIGRDHLLESSDSNINSLEDFINQDDGNTALLTTHKKSFANTDYISSRNDAINQLVVIAKFFKENEPHSPVSAGIEKAIRWARMPFEQLMQELIPNGDARNTFQLMTGVSLSTNEDDNF
jgi:type VI secretion system protein ImpA